MAKLTIPAPQNQKRRSEFLKKHPDWYKRKAEGGPYLVNVFKDSPGGKVVV